jgi:hypothetical protein
LFRAQLVELADRVLASVACELTVVPVNHGQAGTQERERSKMELTARSAKGRECMPEIVDSPRSSIPAVSVPGPPVRRNETLAGA